MNRKSRCLSALILNFLVGLLIAECLCAAEPSSPFTVTDSGGKTIRLKDTPKRVVSLVPGATEVFFALNAGDMIVGLTLHDVFPAEVASKAIVGGFFDPSPEMIEKLRPDLILLSSLHGKIRQKFSDSGIPLIQVDAPTMEDGFKMIELVGTIAGRREEATAKINMIRSQLDVVSRKVEKIPENKRKRVMRIMVSETIMTPGDGSFQNELIRCAGGIPPAFVGQAAVAPVTQEQWIGFNPQVVYCCGNEAELSRKLFQEPGWKDTEAVRNNNVAMFPCDLTCRASVNMGNFVAWLAAVIYPEEFSDDKTVLEADKVVGFRELPIDLPYIKSAGVLDGTMKDFPTQTLVIDFTEPMAGLNSLAGSLSGLQTVGNHYLSPPLWTALHTISIEDLKRNLCKTVGRDDARTSFLFTGARMDSLSVQKMRHKDMIVYALVTAGVEANAERAAVDEGNFYEPGTINIIILTNMQLTSRALTRTIISATEAKSAALQDLDVRSSYSPRYPATGTGTDEILVVEGRGEKVENAGGHSKLGELIAKSVYRGVKESIALQNGLLSGRSVFRRIRERKIDLCSMVAQSGKFSPLEAGRMCSELESLLLDPANAGLLEWAFALSDAHQSGLIHDLQSFQDGLRLRCEAISGVKPETWIGFVPDNFAPKAICMAFDAFLNGLYHKNAKAAEATERFGTCNK